MGNVDFKFTCNHKGCKNTFTKRSIAGPFAQDWGVRNLGWQVKDRWGQMYCPEHKREELE